MPTNRQLRLQARPKGLLAPGDLLLIATDGILEAENKNGAEFGLDQLGSLLVENRTQPLATITQAIHQALSTSYIQSDDQSLLLIRVMP